MTAEREVRAVARERQRLRRKLDRAIAYCKRLGFTPGELRAWWIVRMEAQDLADAKADRGPKGENADGAYDGYTLLGWLAGNCEANLDEPHDCVRSDHEDLLAIMERAGKPQAKRPRKGAKPRGGPVVSER